MTEWAARVGGLALVVFATLGLESRATGQTLTLRSRTVYHGYQVRLLPEADRDGPRRNLNRFYQTIDVGGWGVASGDIDAVLSLRYDTDFGTGFNRDTPFTAGVPAVDGRNDFDLLYMYVDWRNVVDGLVDLRFGRQVVTDPLAWYALDGLRVSGHLWQDGVNRLDADVYFGLPVRYDAVFSSEPFLNDGTDFEDSAGFISGVVFGGSADLRLLTDLSLSVAYRQELELRDDELPAFRDQNEAAARSEGTLGLQESRLGVSAGYTVRPLRGHLYASMVWDALVGALEQARAGAGWDPWRGVHVQAEYLRSRPRFAGDSIFNLFNIFGYDRGRLELTFEVIDGLEIEAGYLLQVFGGGALSDDSTFAGSDASHGPSVGIHYRDNWWGVGGHFEAATNTSGDYAYGGNYRMGWLYGTMSFFEGRLSGDARVSLTTFQNDWFERVDGGLVADPDNSVNVNLTARSQITDWISARVMYVQNFGSYLEGNYRLLTELAVTY